jgi:L,D-transpeptidase ErfK/SrfK
MIALLRIFAPLLLLAMASGAALARTYPLPEPGIDVIGGVQTVTAHANDTLLDIARRYGLGFEDIKRANPELDIWIPGAGSPVLLPTQYILPDGPREGIVINLPEMRLYYFPPPAKGQAAQVVTYPLSIGRREWATPFGDSVVTTKVKDPVWFPPASVRKEHAEDGRLLASRVEPGPDNPLGKYAMGLNLPGYFIHGTNRPYGIGLRVTHGCLRLYPEDIETLFNTVPVGTRVRLVNQPYKAGWRDGTLYLEVHDPLEEASEENEKNHSGAVSAIVTATRERASAIIWERVQTIITRASGMPVPISADHLEAEAIASSMRRTDANSLPNE